MSFWSDILQHSWLSILIHRHDEVLKEYENSIL